MSVLAYIDGSQFTESVCLHAAWAAQQLETGVNLVHVLEYASTDTGLVEDRFGFGALETEERTVSPTAATVSPAMDAERESRQDILHAAARDIRSRGVEHVKTAIEYGSLEDHIREHGQAADMIVVGKRGEHSASQHGRLGDHLERVIRASGRPVLIAPSEPRQIRRFLIAFDGGQQSGNAIRFLIDETLLRGCDGILMLAGDQVGLQHQLHDAESRLHGAGYSLQAEMGHGSPDRVIPDILNTEDIDLLVMGGYSHSRLHALLGLSTTRRLLRSSTKAILVVR